MSKDRSQLLTEKRLDASMNLDAMSVDEALAVMNRQDRIAVEAVEKVRGDVARAIEIVVAAFKSGGRLFYVGAGSSGRLGILDASECPPTFRTDASMVQGIMAGGERAVFASIEGAEDSSDAGASAIDERKIGPRDVVMGIAAGGTTPFVHGALHRAKKFGAKTIFLTCVERIENEPPVDLTIRALTGPEVLTGSTRLKAGTATKLILNQITTLSMVQLGKCYENLMVDLRATNDKLWDRGARIVATVTGLDREKSMQLLGHADGQVKVAIVMQTGNLSAEDARALLEKNLGSLRKAMSF